MSPTSYQTALPRDDSLTIQVGVAQYGLLSAVLSQSSTHLKGDSVVDNQYLLL